MEVVEEDVFFKWKEEVNDEYPGKGKALFQVGLFFRFYHALLWFIINCPS